MCRRYVDDIVLLDDPTILAGMRFAARADEAGARAGRRRRARRGPGRADPDPGWRAGRGRSRRAGTSMSAGSGRCSTAAATLARGGGVTEASADPSREPGRTAGRRRHRAPIEPPPTADGSPPPTRPLAPEPAAPPGPAVESTRRLLGASFDLLTRTSDDMRRASFYIGLITLGTVGPLALAAWAHRGRRRSTAPRARCSRSCSRGAAAGTGCSAAIAGLGLLVAAVESRAMAAAILGGHYAGRPVDVRPALARSRMVFWRVVVGVDDRRASPCSSPSRRSASASRVLGPQTDVSIVASTLAAALVGAPLAYLLTGVVLGDVDPIEATRRSLRVFRARKARGGARRHLRDRRRPARLARPGRRPRRRPAGRSARSVSGPNPGRPA